MTLVHDNTIGVNTDTLITKTYTIAYILIFKNKYISYYMTCVYIAGFISQLDDRKKFGPQSC